MKYENRLSKSEKQFFYKPQELKKTFFKAIDKKQLGKYYSSEFFLESSYFYYEDKDEELCELVDSIERLIKQEV